MAIKVGTEDRKKVAIAAALGLVVLLLAARTIFGGPDTPAVPVPQPVPVSAVPAPALSSTATASRAPAVLPAGESPRTSAAQLDPTLHPELMAENESFVYAGNGRNIFSMSSAPAAAPVKIEKVKAPIRPSVQVAQAPAGPPPPPNIDLKFFGYSARRDGSRKAFLLHGEDVFIASEGDVVSHRYKVGKIAANSVMVEDLPYHNTQSLPLVAN